MADYNAESIKQLAADLYGAGNIAAKDYSADYAALATKEQARQNAALQNYNTAVDALAQEQAAAYQKTKESAKDLSLLRLDRAPETRTMQGGGIYGTAGQDLTESAKILHDNALGASLGEIASAEKTQAEELELAKRLAEYRRRQNVYQDMADLEQQRIAAQRQEQQATAADILTANQSLDSVMNRIYNQERGEALLTEEQKQNAIANELARLEFEERQKQYAAEYELALKEFAEKQNQNTTQNELAQLELQERQKQNAAENELDWQSFTEKQKQNAIAEELSRLRFAEQQKQNAAEYELTSSEFAEKQKQNAYNNAIMEINTFGKVMTNAAAEVLGVPIGTSAVYAAANVAGKSGGGGGGTPKAKDTGISVEDYQTEFTNAVELERENGQKGGNTTYEYMRIMAEMKANGEPQEKINSVARYMTVYTETRREEQEKALREQQAALRKK